MCVKYVAMKRPVPYNLKCGWCNKRVYLDYYWAVTVRMKSTFTSISKLRSTFEVKVHFFSRSVVSVIVPFLVMNAPCGDTSTLPAKSLIKGGFGSPPWHVSFSVWANHSLTLSAPGDSPAPLVPRLPFSLPLLFLPHRMA